ncbi:transcription coactivator [Perilla frutescens var. frutescens]|nr:transcription coactivator [Perilla frutescens var. frutescens]
MMESKQISVHNDHSNAFVGVRFVLFGFDSVTEDKVQSKLLEGGGVDALNYGPDCNHVIVNKLVYDDPICIAARRDGKILVTGLWVDHSFDVGMPVDPTSVMYRPVRDLDGILGANSLVMCLTGYQRQDRDDIMTMVAMMGANFSKPLVANKVTHLICYKFEGEKYELAKKVKAMKLVNHRWLEDCLKAWELLPEADYAKSGYELEMEAEAKDSEEETEDMTSVDLKMKSVISPQNTRVENKNFHQSPERQGISRNTSYLSAFETFSNVRNTSKTQSTPRKETDYGKTSFSTHDEHPNMSNSSCARSPAKMSSEAPSHVPDGTLISEKIEHVLASASGSAKKFVDGGLSKLSSKSMKASLPLRSERIENNSVSPSSNASKLVLRGGIDMPSERHLNGIGSHGIKTPLKGTLLHPDEGQTAGLPSKTKPTIPCGSSRSPVVNHSPKTLLRSGLATKPMEMPVSRSPIDSSCRLASDISLTNGTSCSREEVSGGFAMPSEKDKDGIGSGGVKTPLKGDLLFPDEEQTSSLTGKKKKTVSRGDSKSTKLSCSPKILMGIELDTKLTEMPVSGSSVHGSCQLDVDVLPTNVTSHLRKKVSGVFNMPSERDQDGIESGVVKSPLKGALLHLDEEQTSSLPDKKKMTVSRGRSKSTKLSHPPKTKIGSGLDTKPMEMPVSGSLIHGSRQSAVDVSPPTNTNSHSREEVSLASKEALVILNLQEDRKECNDQPLQRSRGRPKKRMFPDSDAKDLSLSRTKLCTGIEETLQSDPQGTRPPFPSTSSRVDQLDGQEDMNCSKVDHSGTQLKPQKKTMLSRKTLGSKPTLRKGSTTKHKEFISAVLQNEFASHSNGAVAAIGDTNIVSLAEKFVTVSPTTNEDVSVGDETEPPECEGPNEFDMGSKNSAEVEEPHSGKPTHARKQPSEKPTKMKKGPKSRVTKCNAVKQSDCSQKTEFPESKSTDDVAEIKITEGKKRPLAKSKLNKSKNPTEETKQDEENTVSHNEEMVVLAGKTSKRPSKKLKSSDDVEKENEPVTNEQQSVSRDTGSDGKLTRKVRPVKSDCKADTAKTEGLHTEAEPAWFILSGHRLQRKEFQQVIKRLKGRVCRDSHNWSYQGTHLIVPDPIRRTEKFFAAAASGSWILKTDYLTASNEAGRFLSEEPYEWHKKCLTEDGAINLEAPRKWRLLRERTGHCAFYGMRIVIYGECIAPPRETLKRVVKAGDGTILATSPPYTRFLKSRIDFAIVSPGMPRVDMWVQEFLRHEIPCVLADYLVEYVCKPGYSLERHVQYNTHAWAQRSLQNHVNRVEAVEDPTTPDDHRVDDAACQVCGSRDREDEMLICADEGGTHGCGVGTHIGCLDPPLQHVPEEDWFCRECCRKPQMKTSARSSKKRASKLNK